MVRYTLLDNGFCVCEVDTLSGKDKQITFFFENAEAGSVLSVTYADKQYYRPLDNGYASVPAPTQSCRIKVCVLNDGNVLYETYLTAILYKDNVVVSCDLDDLQEQIRKTRKAIADLTKLNAELTEQVRELDDKLNKLYEGYDID